MACCQIEMRKPTLTVAALKVEAQRFAEIQSSRHQPDLFGVTDGKAVGTYVEHGFREHLRAGFEFKEGSSAKGIDFPGLDVDVKVTSARQPQSSCPYRSARQKIFGLGYSVIVFVYEKTDDPDSSTSYLRYRHIVFIEKEHTADFQTISNALQWRLQYRRVIDRAGTVSGVLKLR